MYWENNQLNILLDFNWFWFYVEGHWPGLLPLLTRLFWATQRISESRVLRVFLVLTQIKLQIVPWTKSAILRSIYFMLLQNGDLLLWILQEKKLIRSFHSNLPLDMVSDSQPVWGGGIVCQFIFPKKFYWDNLIRNTIFPLFFKGIQLFPWFLLG